MGLPRGAGKREKEASGDEEMIDVKTIFGNTGFFDRSVRVG